MRPFVMAIMFMLLFADAHRAHAVCRYLHKNGKACISTGLEQLKNGYYRVSVTNSCDTIISVRGHLVNGGYSSTVALGRGSSEIVCLAQRCGGFSGWSEVGCESDPRASQFGYTHP